MPLFSKLKSNEDAVCQFFLNLILYNGLSWFAWYLSNLPHVIFISFYIFYLNIGVNSLIPKGLSLFTSIFGLWCNIRILITLIIRFLPSIVHLFSLLVVLCVQKYIISNKSTHNCNFNLNSIAAFEFRNLVISI